MGAGEEGGARLGGSSCVFIGRQRSSASQSKFQMMELFRHASEYLGMYLNIFPFSTHGVYWKSSVLSQGHRKGLK